MTHLCSSSWCAPIGDNFHGWCALIGDKSHVGRERDTCSPKLQLTTSFFLGKVNIQLNFLGEMMVVFVFTAGELSTRERSVSQLVWATAASIWQDLAASSCSLPPCI